MPAYSFKKRFVAPIRVGLGLQPSVEEFAAGLDQFGNVHRPPPKLQTIRAVGNRRHARPGETVQLYTAMRTRQCTKIGEGRCTAASEIVIAFGRTPSNTIISIDGRALYTGTALSDFARLDGFEDWTDMCRFWEDEHGIDKPFSGVLIRWEPFT